MEVFPTVGASAQLASWLRQLTEKPSPSRTSSWAVLLRIHSISTVSDCIEQPALAASARPVTSGSVLYAQSATAEPDSAIAAWNRPNGVAHGYSCM